MAKVQLEGVRKVYDNGQVAVQGASFEVADGELMVLVGPSGCGKSTLLRMIAGLEDISAGTLKIGERVVNDVAPKDRDIAMVFQSYALYPHMTVAENLAFGLKLRGHPKQVIAERVNNAAELLGLTPMLDKLPKAMSGGQRQRVALGRAMVRESSVFLLDEPLSNLDAKLRHSVRTEIAQLHRKLGTTMIYVTHDQVEAMTLGQRIVVLKDGVIQQIDSPMALYDRPANLFVAGFLGSPAMNVLQG
ncbi:ATP-binding cassette domain-containing protein, partial [Xanthomonas perforans]